MSDSNLLAALVDATAVEEAVYFNDDKIEHGQAILDNLHATGYTVVRTTVPVEGDRERRVDAFHAHPDGCDGLDHPSWRPHDGYKCERLAGVSLTGSGLREAAQALVDAWDRDEMPEDDGFDGFTFSVEALRAALSGESGEPNDAPMTNAHSAADSLTGSGLARAFHEAYERLAPSFGYETRRDSAVPWEAVPEPNRSLMIAVAGEVLVGVSLTGSGLREAAQDAADLRPAPDALMDNTLGGQALRAWWFEWVAIRDALRAALSGESGEPTMDGSEAGRENRAPWQGGPQ